MGLGIRPETEAALAEMVAGADGPLAIRGGGTRGIACDGAVLDTGGLSGISLYEPGALTLVVGAGTPLPDIEAALAAEGQRLAFEPMDHRGLLGTNGVPTIGGVVAGNVSGPRRIQAGACRDFLLGVRFVDGAGRIVKNGGRVMKNVTGYDLVKLMAGSWGTLGVLTEVSLKVLPAPETRACVLINGLTDDDAVAVMSTALGSPYDVSGAAHMPAGMDGHPVTMLRIEGFAGSVAYRSDRLRALFADRGATVEADPERVREGWEWVRDVALFHGEAGDVWRISVKPSDGPEAVRRMAPRKVVYDWGGGLIWALMTEGSDARAKLRDLPGHATRVKGSGDAPAFQSQPDAIARISRGLKQRFDPKGLFNPGVLVA